MKPENANIKTGFEPLESRMLFAADFSLQVLHASDLEGGVDAITNAPNFAAIVEGLENDAAGNGVESILLSAGDNFIPGPFYNASGDRAAFRDSGLFNDIYNELFGVNTFDSLREGNGRVDISIMNVLGFDASAIGNHEFDAGSDAFKSIIEEDFRSPNGPSADRWVGAQFPYLSANLDFSGDADLGGLYTSSILPNTDFVTGPVESAAGNSSVPKLAPATTIARGGQLIGVVGATTQLIDQISSPSGTVDTTGGQNDMNALAAAIQPVINDLTNLGVNKIILVSHLQQIALEQQLAGILEGVDIIIAGGSDTILANGDDTLNPGDAAGDTYPIVTTDANGDPTLIVSTNGEYSYVGQLTVDFDAAGILIDAADNPLDDVSDLDLTVNGPVASTDANVAAIWGNLVDPFAAGTKAEKVQRLVDAVTAVVTATDGNVFGQTDVFIDGRREGVRTQETNMGNLTADANLFTAKNFDSAVEISIKNGGGIRNPIGEVDGLTGELLPTQANATSGKLAGEISQLDIDNTLRFNNGLTLLTVDAQELKYILEHAVAATAPGATPGQFPQIGGLRFSFDPTGSAIQFNNDTDIAGGAPVVAQDGSRIQNVVIVDDNGDVIDVIVENGVVLNPSRDIRMVTLDFMFGIFSSSPNFGGDGYPFPAFAENVVQLKDQTLADGVATFADAGTEQDALAEYLAATYPADSLDPLNEKPAFCEEETAPGLDQRIQDVTARFDTIIPVAASTIFVTNGNDSGAGSLRAALQIANANDGVKRIIVDDSVNSIKLDSSVHYTGGQDLKIDGNDTTIKANDGFTGHGVIISSGDADLTFKDLTVNGDFDAGEESYNGIYVPVSAKATGRIDVVLHNVKIVNSGLFGLHIADQLNDSDASIKLVMINTVIKNNGIGELDQDGVRVDEGGEGNLYTTVINTKINANGGDGLELDERGDGTVFVNVLNSEFKGNGFFDVADLDDGFDIDEAGAGSIIASVINTNLVNNQDEGLDFDEEDGGNVVLNLRNLKVNGNFDEGIKMSEEGDGSITGLIRDVTANNNGDDGIELEEADAGSILATLKNITANKNGDEGIQIEETGTGNLTAFLFDVVAKKNEGNGLQLTEGDEGNLFAKVKDSILNKNEDDGILAEQELSGFGSLFLDNVTLNGNDNPYTLDNVSLS